MYKNTRPYRSNNNRRNNFSRGRNSGGSTRRNNGPTRFQKSFNPRDLVKQASESVQSDVYVPKHAFSDFEIDSRLKQNILKKGYTSPTPIQDQSIPFVLEGRDIIGIANTGTGKTAAFLVPLIQKVLNNPHKKVLIVAPTRELAVQIRDEFIDFVAGLNMFSVLCIGGANMHRQKRDLRQKFNFVIGTPGRIRDLVETNNINLNVFDSVVLDEADHMVDIGFIHDIKYFISCLPRERQSLFFSATITGAVKEVIAQFVNNPVTVSVKTRETAENIDQDIIKVDSKNRKIELLHDLLISDGFEKVLIFGQTKWGVQKLSDELVRRGFKAGAIHGNKKQNQRLRTLEQFKRNEIQILLATDVVSRGLDIDNVSHVINYDMPASYEDYVHRIGRTGRADKKGIALTFVE